ncbi:hypothetical protein D9757_013175 [Collybiopsis confluens]|uniref:Uncharacterized protein n=1 Tax=Collybiopsis confluens TaxID=2823264 RepID=A0A8H5FXR4_9AGAR|nr:hypothetical protein D9757_013175 [Collybiopsis confluens]
MESDSPLISLTFTANFDIRFLSPSYVGCSRVLRAFPITFAAVESSSIPFAPFVPQSVILPVLGSVRSSSRFSRIEDEAWCSGIRPRAIMPMFFPISEEIQGVAVPCDGRRFLHNT